MITRVQFGNIYNTGGKQVVSGTNSGYDTEGLIKGLTEAKRLPAVSLETKIEQNGAKQEAFAELQSLLSTFREASGFLRNVPGVDTDIQNIFSYRTSELTSNTSIGASSYLEATIEPGADLASYNITVDELATYNIKTTASFALANVNTSVVDGGGPLNSGTWAIGPHGTNVTLAAGDTLQQVVDKFNAVSDTSEIRATALEVSSGNFVLQLKSTTTGTAMNYALPGGLLNVGLAINQSAVNAELTIDGTTVIRSTNTISDAIDGVTFDLVQVTPAATTLALDIESDKELVKNGILNFVDSYNELRLFISRQTQVGNDGKPLETSVLAGSNTLRSTLSSIINEMSAAVAGLSSDPDSLADLGITFADFPGDDETPYTRNILSVDEDTLNNKLASDFDGVRQVFEFDFTSSSSEIQVFSRTNALDISAFSLNVNVGTSTYQATYDPGTGPVTINLTGSAITGGGYLIEGQAGTVLEGLRLIYGGSTTVTSNITVTQGIGDRLFNTIDALLDEDSGAVAIEISSLEDSNTRAQEEIDRIDQMVEKYRDQLLAKFSALESTLGAINTILASLDAQANAYANG